MEYLVFTENFTYVGPFHLAQILFAEGKLIALHERVDTSLIINFVIVPVAVEQGGVGGWWLLW